MSFGQPLPVLMYHHVSPQPGLVTCSPENFRAQMQWLAKNGWRTLSTADFAEALASGRVPQKSVLVTFDDGYLDNWVYAYPVLQEFGQRATIFLITGWIGDGAPRAYSGQPGRPEVPTHKQAMAAAADGKLDAAFLRWSEVEAMRAAETFDFHTHTHTHTRWDRKIAAQAERDTALAEDLAVSRETLAARLWEWGVTLWSRAPEHIKDIVYSKRFDRASAKYAEFGPFYVGYVMSGEESLKHVRV